MTDNEDMDYLKKLVQDRKGSYKEPHTHCWHKIEMGYSFQLTPDWKEKCCWCGATRTVHREAVTPEGHGPYAPKVYRDRYDDK